MQKKERKETSKVFTKRNEDYTIMASMMKIMTMLLGLEKSYQNAMKSIPWLEKDLLARFGNHRLVVSFFG